MSQAPAVTLVLGGVRSGKSRYAEALVEAGPGPWTYLAAGRPGDAEMAARINAHRAQRGAGWRTVEAPGLHLAGALADAAGSSGTLLVESLGAWMADLVMADRPPSDEAAETPLLAAIAAAGTRATVVLVGDEVGMGGVAMSPLGRAFADRNGRLNERVAALAHRVVLVAAGLPLRLKG